MHYSTPTYPPGHQGRNWDQDTTESGRESAQSDKRRKGLCAEEAAGRSQNVLARARGSCIRLDLEDAGKQYKIG